MDDGTRCRHCGLLKPTLAERANPGAVVSNVPLCCEDDADACLLKDRGIDVWDYVDHLRREVEAHAGRAVRAESYSGQLETQIARATVRVADLEAARPAPVAIDRGDDDAWEPMGLFELTSGRCGESYVRAYAWASSDAEAIALYVARHGIPPVETVELFRESSRPFVTALSDSGWGTDE